MPLPRDPGDPGDPGENSGRLYSMRRRVQIDTFARNWASNFRKNPGKSLWALQGAPRDPQGTPEGPPRDPQGTPEGPHGGPKAPKGSSKGTKWAPKSSQGHPKASPRATKTSQGDKLYIKKLPINRLRGKLVISLYAQWRRSRGKSQRL